MKIGIDHISAFGTGGNGTYTRELVRALSVLDHPDSYVLYTYLHHVFPRLRYAPPGNHAVFAGAYSPSFPFPWLTDIAEATSRACFRFRTGHDRLDVMHFTNPLFYVKGLPRQVRIVTTIHDLAFLKHPEWSKSGSVDRLKPALKEIVQRSEALIAVSKKTKDDILEIFPEAKDKVSVVYEGVSAVFKPNRPGPEFFKRYGIKQRYILSVGEIQPRKNLDAVLKAYTALPASLRKDVSLVLAGAPRNASAAAALRKGIGQLGIAPDVRVLGYVPAEDLAQLYAGAVLFAYMSFYEGFGLPVLESMACGTAVVTSNASSLPEVGGDACLYADPSSPEEIAEKIRSLLENDVQKDKMRAKGFERVRMFTWEIAASETREVYNKVLE